MKNISIIIILVILASKAHGQNFLNPDLNGIVDGPFSLPTNWQNVPFTDINCLANSESRATPDLTDLNGPNASFGLLGNPYSGNTFVSGGRSTFETDVFQEGIMQTVSGFIPNTIYTINFQQSVVKQINCLDQSGSWEVYIDNNLAGISLPTFSNEPYNSTTFIWESRSISFIASANSHTIKFLPQDDDLNIEISTSDTQGALRMGIDSIYLTSCNLPPINFGDDVTLCLGETLTLDVTSPNATYLWHDNSTSSTLNVMQPGTYWVELTVNNCSRTDTIIIYEGPCDVILELPNVFTPSNDGINDLFVPIKSEGIASMHTIISNRWGIKVFESNNLAIEWNGRDIPDGVYFWIVNYIDANGVDDTLNGFVTIIR